MTHDRRYICQLLFLTLYSIVITNIGRNIRQRFAYKHFQNYQSIITALIKFHFNFSFMGIKSQDIISLILPVTFVIKINCVTFFCPTCLLKISLPKPVFLCLLLNLIFQSILLFNLRNRQKPKGTVRVIYQSF